METTDKTEDIRQYIETSSLTTRTYLIGSGIVCGLRVFVDGHCSIHLDAGYAVTSAGWLVQVKHNLELRYYREFVNTDNYTGLPLPADKYPIWELLKEPAKGARPLAPQTVKERESRFPEDKIICLYIDPATKVLRILMVSQAYFLKKSGVQHAFDAHIDKDFDSIFDGSISIEADSTEEAERLSQLLHPHLRLREVPLRRFGFGYEETPGCPPEDLVPPHFPEINSFQDTAKPQEIYKHYALVIDEALEALDKQLRLVHAHYTPLLTHRNRDYLDQAVDLMRRKWYEFHKYTLNTPGNATAPDKAIRTAGSYFIQYFYDWARDLIHTYHELKADLHELMAQCSPDEKAFPQHILLGRAKGGATTYRPQPFRHYFRQPPIYNDNANRLQKIRVVHWRLITMIRTFNPPGLDLPGIVDDDCDVPNTDVTTVSVKITPSPSFRDALSEQAIPYYYPLSTGSESVHQYWHFAKTKIGATDTLVSYHGAEPDAAYSSRPQVVRPLLYDFHRCAFYRVEGHIGRAAAAVQQEIDTLKWQYNLCFDVKKQDITTSPLVSKSITVLNNSQDPAQGSQTIKVSNLFGAEHIGGVEYGGTLLLLTETNDTGNEIIVADFALPNPFYTMP